MYINMTNVKYKDFVIIVIIIIIRRHTEYLSIFSPNAGKCRKNVDQNNSDYGLFLRSVHKPSAWRELTHFKDDGALEVRASLRRLILIILMI